MKYLPIHFSSSIWLRDNLWTNLNQFCVQTLVQTLWNLSCLLRIFDCMDVSISLNLLVFVSFPPTSVAFLGTFRANPVAPRRAIGFVGAIESIGDIFIALMGVISIAPSPVNLYCTYTVIISSGLPEALIPE